MTQLVALILVSLALAQIVALLIYGILVLRDDGIRRHETAALLAQLRIETELRLERCDWKPTVGGARVVHEAERILQEAGQ